MPIPSITHVQAFILGMLAARAARATSLLKALSGRGAVKRGRRFSSASVGSSETD